MNETYRRFVFLVVDKKFHVREELVLACGEIPKNGWERYLSLTVLTVSPKVSNYF